jgi:uncharacterized membrane protein YhaH (DUF805 family)
MSWYLAVWQQYAVFSGRARRKEYWMFALFNFIVSFILGLVTGFLGGILGVGTTLSNAATVAYSLAVLIPGIAVAVRRMHDTGRSGWWVLLPIVNLVFLCLDSQPDANEYGPNPKMALDRVRQAYQAS